MVQKTESTSEGSRSISISFDYDAETINITVTAHRNHQYKRTDHDNMHDARAAFETWNGIPEEARNE